MDQDFITWAVHELGGNVVVAKVANSVQSIVYKLSTSHEAYFLKIAAGLVKEREHLDWVHTRLPTPLVIGFTGIAGKDALLIPVRRAPSG